MVIRHVADNSDLVKSKKLTLKIQICSIPGFFSIMETIITFRDPHLSQIHMECFLSRMI